MPNIIEPHIKSKSESIIRVEGSVLTPKTSYNQFSAISPLKSIPEQFNTTDANGFTLQLDEGFLRLPEQYAETAPQPPPDLSGGASGEALPSLSKDKITPPEKEQKTRPSVRELDRDVERWKQRKAYIAKQAHAIVENAETFFKKYGKNYIGFFTVTFAEDLQFENEEDWKEASKRWDSFNTHVIKGLFKDYMLVKEPMAKGRIHFHLLVACQEDIHTGFDFEAFKFTYTDEFKYQWTKAQRKKYWKKVTTSKYLSGLWALFQNKCKKYGFGRHELLPIKKEGECVARYVGKYLDSYRNNDLSLEILFDRKPGRVFSGRRVTYSQGWKSCSMGFVFAGTGHKRYREAMQKISDFLGLKSEDEMKIKFGVKWGWKLRPIIRDVMETGELSDDVKLMLKFQALKSIQSDYKEIRSLVNDNSVNSFGLRDQFERFWRYPRE